MPELPLLSLIPTLVRVLLSLLPLARLLPFGHKDRFGGNVQSVIICPRIAFFVPIATIVRFYCDSHGFGGVDLHTPKVRITGKTQLTHGSLPLLAVVRNVRTWKESDCISDSNQIRAFR